MPPTMSFTVGSALLDLSDLLLEPLAPLEQAVVTPSAVAPIAATAMTRLIMDDFPSLMVDCCVRLSDGC
jgi:hypothetical protein